jgi:hypothetical protein
LKIDLERGVEGELKGLVWASPTGYLPPEVLKPFAAASILMTVTVRRFKSASQNGNVG